MSDDPADFDFVLMDLVSAYQDHRRTSQYRAAVRRSEEDQADQKRFSNKIWWAHFNYAQGRKLAIQVRDDVVDFNDLSSKQQQLVNDFDDGHAARTLDELLAQQRPPYREAGSDVTA